MPLNIKRVRTLLRNFDFKTLFVEELGWDHYTSILDIPVDGQNFALGAIAEKRGIVIFVCGQANNGSMPGYSIRRKIERQVTKSHSEDAIGLGMPFYAVGMRCIGYIKSQEQTLPRMHHKFLVFLRQRDKADQKVEEGAWPYLPYAVWTGSYNITKNGNCSLENALYVQDMRLAEAYCNEWAQLIEVSEPIDWTKPYSAPELDYNTGACIS